MKALVPDYKIVIDSNEVGNNGGIPPWTFTNIKHDKRYLAIEKEIRKLKTGDYSLAGFEDQVTIERKSLPDLFSTLVHGRERFCKELERMSSFHLSAVVIEGDWEMIYNPGRFLPRWQSDIHPNSVVGTMVAFINRYPWCHWYPMRGQREAEVWTWRILHYFHREWQKEWGKKSKT